MALASALVLAAARAVQDSTLAQIQPLEEQPERLDPPPAVDQEEAQAAVREAVVVDQAPARIFVVVEAAVVEVAVVAEGVAEAKAGLKAPRLSTARSALHDNALIKSTSAS